MKVFDLLIHNTGVALRNLSKYKLQTLISVLSMAIGIVVLATVHSYVRTYLKPPQISTMPYYDRVYRLHLKEIEHDSVETKRVRHVPDFALRALRSGDGLYCVEMGPTVANVNHSSSLIYYILSDSVKKKLNTEYRMTDPSYPRCAGMRSALTGERIAELRQGEAIIDETVARHVFGDTNPRGKLITPAFNSPHSPFDTLMIADVYQNFGKFDDPQYKGILYALDEEAMMEGLRYSYSPKGERPKYRYHAFYMEMVLKEGCTPDRLEEEANRKLAPFGLETDAEWLKKNEAHTVDRLVRLRTLYYLMGTLILLAACIGFLRMQLQQFWMRKREMVLRIVNGAKRRDLFVLLMTEVGMVLVASIALALLMGLWIEPFLNALYSHMEPLDKLQIVENVLPYSVVLGLGLLAIFGLVVWIVLSRICNTSFNLATGMRGSRTHTFRNAMLLLQICIGMLFTSGALLLAVVCEKRLDQFVLPEDEKPFRETIYLQPTGSSNMIRFIEDLRALRWVDRLLTIASTNLKFDKISRNDSLVDKVLGHTRYFESILAPDTAILDFYQMKVKWIRPEVKEEKFILIREDLYTKLESAGVLANGMLTTDFFSLKQLPVAGTFKGVPFNIRNDNRQVDFIAIDPDNIVYCTFLLIPLPGHYDELWNELRQYLAPKEAETPRLEPVQFNFFEHAAALILLHRSVRPGCWILGGMALLICVMGIYSTIALDTRSRRKEVAIRKINGAKTGDIAILFARLYVVLVLLAFLITLPVPLLMKSHLWLTGYIPYEVFNDTATMVFILLGGCLIVSLSILLIVGWHVRRVMRINPAEMIAKE